MDWEKIGSATTGSQGEKGDAGEKGEKGDTGEAGLTPYIGENGNWWLGNVDTGVAAKGAAGTQGEKGEKGEKGDTGASGQNGRDGRDGADGADGVGIARTEINDAGELIITYTNGVVTNLGKIVGSGGKSGTNGKDGVGIAKTEINDAGELVITYTDGTVTNLGSDIMGISGTDGADGLTPYIGENGNWWIGDEDTGVKASAEAVIPASSGAVTQTRTIAIIAIVMAGVSLLGNIGTITYIVMRRRRRRHH